MPVQPGYLQNAVEETRAVVEMEFDAGMRGAAVDEEQAGQVALLGK